MSLDAAEDWANAIGGYLIAIVMVAILRATGLWLTLPAWAVAAIFFGLSWGRSRALRAWFRSIGNT